MVPVVPNLTTLLALVTALIVVAGLAYWAREPEKVKDKGRAALSLIKRVTSYPVVVVLIVVFHFVSCLGTVVNYTVRRVGGIPVKKINLKVTFD